jgi:hypothetical protein
MPHCQTRRCLPYHLYRRAYHRQPLHSRFAPKVKVPPPVSSLPWLSPDPKEEPFDWLDDFEREIHCFIHHSFIMNDFHYGATSHNMNKFIHTLDPLTLICSLKFLQQQFIISSTSDTQAISTAKSLVASYVAYHSSLSPDTHVQFPSNFPTTDCFAVYHIKADPLMPIVIDTGASFSLTPNEHDFISEIQPTAMQSLKQLTSEAPVVGEGIVEWHVKDLYGIIRTI